MKNTKAINQPDQVNKIIGLVIFGIYLLLIIFGIISLNSPNWLKDISKFGQESEARTMKNYGDYYLNNHDYQMAIAQYNKAILINPNLAEAYSNMGIAYKNLGDFKTALTHLEKALTYENILHDATYFNIAEIFDKSGNPEMAIEYYIKSAEISPFSLSVYQKIGELLNNTKQWKGAADAFDKALENSYTLKKCYSGMLKRDYYLFLDEKAKQEIKKLAELGVENIDLSSYDEKVFNMSLSRNPEISSIYNQYGYNYAMQGDYDKAIEYFKKALEITPDFQNAKNNLNAAYAQQKK
ncbi:MAG: tetratricopeptide repeat protein [Saprospiraceae bacterium]|nr:tetratricopeptide repeat protein [Saprospiraceae bacterium]